MTIKKIIFDCDGVLVDTKDYITAIATDVLKQHGLNFTEDDYITSLGRGVRGTIQAVFKKNSKAFPADEIEKILPDLEKKHENKIKPLGSISKVIDAINVEIAVATGSITDAVVTKLKVVGLYKKFKRENIFTASHVKNRKPAPDVFNHAAKELGVEPNECLVIEDSVNGVKAAKAAGMMVLQEMNLAA